VNTKRETITAEELTEYLDTPEGAQQLRDLLFGDAAAAITVAGMRKQLMDLAGERKANERYLSRVRSAIEASLPVHAPGHVTAILKAIEPFLARKKGDAEDE